MTYKKGVYAEGDDDFMVVVQIQMADAHENEDASSGVVSIGLRMGDAIIMLRKDIEVTRDFSETPDILLEAELNDTHVWGIRYLRNRRHVFYDAAKASFTAFYSHRHCLLRDVSVLHFSANFCTHLSNLCVLCYAVKTS